MRVELCAPLIRQINSNTEKHINNAMRNLDLTHAQVCMLCALMESGDGCCSMKELERRLGLAQSTTVGIVKRTEEKGLVECLPDPEDHRSKLVRITAEGRRRNRETKEDIDATEDWLLQALTAEERVQFRSLLRRVWHSVSDPSACQATADCSRKEVL